MFSLHVPNGGHRQRGLGAREGVLAGAPDFLVLDPPDPARAEAHVAAPADVDARLARGLPAAPAAGAPHALALELKRAGGRWADVAPEQREVLGRLHALGWVVAWAPGALAAAALLTRLGYPLHPTDPRRWPWRPPSASAFAPSEVPCPFCQRAPSVRINAGALGCEGCLRSWVP